MEVNEQLIRAVTAGSRCNSLQKHGAAPLRYSEQIQQATRQELVNLAGKTRMQSESILMKDAVRARTGH